MGEPIEDGDRVEQGQVEAKRTQQDSSLKTKVRVGHRRAQLGDKLSEAESAMSLATGEEENDGMRVSCG